MFRENSFVFNSGRTEIVITGSTHVLVCFALYHLGVIDFRFTHPQISGENKTSFDWPLDMLIKRSVLGQAEAAVEIRQSTASKKAERYFL